MEPFQLQQATDVPYLTLNRWEQMDPTLVVGVSARRLQIDEDRLCDNYALHVQDDPERVRQNRQQLVDELGFSLSAWTCGNQVHGVHIEQIGIGERGRGNKLLEDALPATDGLFTREQDILLTSFYADCVPLLFYSPDKEIIGVAHAGWKGSVAGIGTKMVNLLNEQGAKHEHLQVAIGPSIGACCYEVDELVMSPVREQLGSSCDTIATATEEGKWRLDLKKFNQELLVRAGVPQKNILCSSYCTSCDEKLFHSHRASGGKAGRIVVWIGKKGFSP
ncbi:peptidoglycan editing factor PgeF [Mechercharimyces sp. CAU 1602]|uniref:peptidoglycan editing factor PgeF n=1 Tax=Mechercharimyces sp. CAU 1602 TaxID=2973933 RepID=UPI0021615817|nr:peptidoglycan editing factor PgeF [Mechercharimyces sp. CAU 1602]MCS1350634.1 peptidoglycan editing factor PgeF [Mechercharimyces sp. CAU 1602]